MSSIESVLLSPLLQYFDQVPAIIQENYVLVACACLYYYDYVLMLPEEVHVIWRSLLRNLSTLFYLAIRYGFFLQITLTLICSVQLAGDAGVKLTADGCTRLQGFIVILNVINFSIISAFVATRLFAMYGRNWYLGVCMFILGMLSPSSITQAAILAFHVIVAPWPLARCLLVTFSSNPWIIFIAQYGPIAFSITAVVYEALCLGLTVAKTFGVYREQKRLRISTTLSSLLLRSGTLYFGALFLLVVLNILGALDPSKFPGYWSLDAHITRAIVPILTTRFIVHLRGMSQDDVSIMLSDFHLVEFADIPRDPSPEPNGVSDNVGVGDRRAARVEQSINRTFDVGSTALA